MIDQHFDPQGWFKVMEHVTDLHNHKSQVEKKLSTSNYRNKGYIENIILTTDFHSNE